MVVLKASETTPAGTPKESPFLLPKQLLAFGESSANEFGYVSSDSLLNPSNKSSWSQPVHHSGLRQFMDNWPKLQSGRAANTSWPDIDQTSDKTQLSISLPLAATDFMSSTSSQTKEISPAATLSPLRLSREFDPTNEAYQRQAHWIPITWETSMGGPLGEVLHSTNNGIAECKNSSALNLMSDGWDNSPRLASSPTGVLQKSSFNSVSNSSTGSSPRAAENLCEDLLGSTFVHAPSLPAL